MTKQTQVNYGFLYCGQLHYGTNPQPVFSLENQCLLGYVNDDLKHNHHLLWPILEAAQTAYQTQPSNYETRKNNLLKLASLLAQHQDDLATLMCQEIGKRLVDCQSEIQRSIQYLTDSLDYYEHFFQAKMVIDDPHWTHNPKKQGVFVKVPLGVIVGIVPFNFPVNLLMTKLVPSYIIGNAIILKGSHQAQLTTSYLASLVYAAGIQDNLVQIINIDGTDELYNNPIVKMVTFTGSSKVGNHIAQTVCKTKLVLEMGGKDCCLVCDDANLDLCAKDIIKGAFSYNGQRCTAIKKVLVCAQNHDRLVDLLLAHIKQLKVGPALANCDITPMIDQKSVSYLQALANDAQTKGAILKPGFQTQGQYVYPCLVDHVTNTMDITWQEQFGPLLPIQIYDNLDQAIQWINQSTYGLQASIYTNCQTTFEHCAAQIDCGTINWNGITSRGPDIFPFSGIKESGMGVQGIQDALESMTRVKGLIYNQTK